MQIDLEFTPHTGRALDVLLFGASAAADLRVAGGATLSLGAAWRGYAGDVRGSAAVFTAALGWEF